MKVGKRTTKAVESRAVVKIKAGISPAKQKFLRILSTKQPRIVTSLDGAFEGPDVFSDSEEIEFNDVETKVTGKKLSREVHVRFDVFFQENAVGSIKLIYRAPSAIKLKKRRAKKRKARPKKGKRRRGRGSSVRAVSGGACNPR